MSEAIIKTGTARLPVWNSKGTETTKDDTTYKAKVEYKGFKNEDGSIFIAVTEKNVGSERNVLVRTEKCNSKEAKAYLKALGWQGQCTNGVEIMYYTVK